MADIRCAATMSVLGCSERAGQAPVPSERQIFDVARRPAEASPGSAYSQVMHPSQRCSNTTFIASFGISPGQHPRFHDRVPIICGSPASDRGSRQRPRRRSPVPVPVPECGVVEDVTASRGAPAAVRAIDPRPTPAAAQHAHLLACRDGCPIAAAGRCRSRQFHGAAGRDVGGELAQRGRSQAHTQGWQGAAQRGVDLGGRSSRWRARVRSTAVA